MRIPIVYEWVYGGFATPPRIDNPFSTGLSSKIYWALYCKPQTGYEVAKKVYGVEKNPRTSKIYPNLKKLEQLGFIKKDKKNNYHILIRPLILQIKKILKKEEVTLNNTEQHYLSLLIGSKTCRKQINYSFDLLGFSNISPHEENFFSSVTLFLSSMAFIRQYFQNKIPKESDLIAKLTRLINKTRTNHPNPKPVDRMDVFEFWVKTCDKLLDDVQMDDQSFRNIKKLYEKRFSIIEKSLEVKKQTFTNFYFDKRTAHIETMFDLLMLGVPSSLLKKMARLNREAYPLLEGVRLGIELSNTRN